MPLPERVLLHELLERPAPPENLGAIRGSPAISTDFSFRTDTGGLAAGRVAHANLTSANLTSANLTSANLTSAVPDARDRFAGPSPLHRLSLLLMCGDAFVVMLAFAASLAFRGGSFAAGPRLSTIAVLSAVLMLAALRGAGAYAPDINDRLRAQLGRVLVYGSAVFALLLALEQATRDPRLFSDASVSTWYIGTLVGLGGLRIIAHMQVNHWRRNGRLARVVAVVDVGGMGRALAGRIRRNDNMDTHFLGVYSLHGDSHNGIDALIRIARVVQVDDIIVAAPSNAMSEVNAAIGQLSATPTNVHVCTGPLEGAFPNFTASMLLDHPVWTVHRRPLDGWSAVVKRAEDLVLGTGLLVLLLPLMGLIAVAIRLDSAGPVLFRQKRLGLGNSMFEILKFRTMTHCEVPEHDVPQAQPNDPRVTRIGRFLRRTSLDELPQLLNVLKGDMSLVGPRPHALPHNDQYSALIEGYWGRHRMRPGITGWAQIHGCRGRTETPDKMQRRVNYDLDYIRNWSLLLDLRVLLMTVVVCLLGWELVLARVTSFKTTERPNIWKPF